MLGKGKNPKKAKIIHSIHERYRHRKLLKLAKAREPKIHSAVANKQN